MTGFCDPPAGEFGNYKRNDVQSFDPIRTPLVFQVISVEETNDKGQDDVLNPYFSSEGNEIVICGCTKSGNSVAVFVNDFMFYLYVEAPADIGEKDLGLIKEALNTRSDGFQITPDITTCDIHLASRHSIYGYQGLEKRNFLKIYAESRSNLLKIKKKLASGIIYSNNVRFSTQKTYESNIPQLLRFMIDTNIRGVSWIELPASSYTFVDEKRTNCQIEVVASYTSIVAHESEGKYSSIAPFRILSFDIECSSRRGSFPKASEDPVIQIGNVLSVQGDTKNYGKVLFSLRECAPIIGTDVRSYDNEGELLQKWSEFICAVDPDIITGYNINGFDFPYLLDRAETLKVKNFPYLSRMRNKKTRHFPSKFSSKAYGIRESKMVNLTGRYVLDVLESVQRDYKLRSYALNSVCFTFFEEQKEDVHYSIITSLHNGNPETRKRLGIYCVKDALLPLKIIEKLMILFNYVEMSRVTGVPISYILSRGQQIRVISLLYREAKSRDYIIPVLQNEEGAADVQFEGAVVIDPIRGYYDESIVTLDFSSLYPSIMIAHNLCYTTWVDSYSTSEKYGLVRDRDYIVTPENAIFLRPSIRKGILPEVLSNLIISRANVKRKLAHETDANLAATLNSRQLALKLTANSVYGFTGTSVGKLPLIAMSTSVTSYGRRMIIESKKLIEERFTRVNGYENDSKVIYGDTDSVMVSFKTKDVQRSIELGKEASEFVTTHFMRPIKLEFEKIYFPYLLINKKRYAGLIWTNNKNYDKLDTKGVETVRRDSCRLVSIVIEKCLNLLLIHKNTEEAIEYVKSVISDLLTDNIDMSLLVITKSLGRTEYASKQAHSELAVKMKCRGDVAPTVGDRVAYVIVKGAKGDLTSMRAEDPLYVLENGLSIDTNYYLQNQLMKPITRIFSPIIGDKVQGLFEGDHVMRVSKTAPKNIGIMKFAIKQETCMGCRTPLKQKGTNLCESCRPYMRSIYQNHVDDLARAQLKYCKLWVQCQQCQGSIHQEVLCTSSDCPIFYMRVKAIKDVESIQKLSGRFSLEW